MPNDGEQPFAAVIAHLLVEESPAEKERLTGVVGMAVGTQPTSAQADGGPPLHRDRSQANA